jgi:hypothetical protein
MRPLEFVETPAGQNADLCGDEYVEVLGGLRGEMMVPDRITIAAIGPTHAQIETHFPLQVNSLHELRLTLGGRSVVAKGRITDCRISDVDQDPATYRVGVEFVELSLRVMGAIRDFVHQVRAATHQPADSPDNLTWF